MGINGVGKSTSLAKVCYYLKQHNIKVMIAACDTFRSGAVEQLRSHARCLDVPLFEKGYLKDPGEVAKVSECGSTRAASACQRLPTRGTALRGPFNIRHDQLPLTTICHYHCLAGPRATSLRLTATPTATLTATHPPGCD